MKHMCLPGRGPRLTTLVVAAYLSASQIRLPALVSWLRPMVRSAGPVSAVVSWPAVHRGEQMHGSSCTCS